MAQSSRWPLQIQATPTVHSGHYASDSASEHSANVVITLDRRIPDSTASTDLDNLESKRAHLMQKLWHRRRPIGLGTMRHAISSRRIKIGLSIRRWQHNQTVMMYGEIA